MTKFKTSNSEQRMRVHIFDDEEARYINKIINERLETIKKCLGIHSPSKMMMGRSDDE